MCSFPYIFHPKYPKPSRPVPHYPKRTKPIQAHPSIPKTSLSIWMKKASVEKSIKVLFVKSILSCFLISKKVWKHVLTLEEKQNRFINIALPHLHRLFVPNLYLSKKYKIVLKNVKYSYFPHFSCSEYQFLQSKKL